MNVAHRRPRASGRTRPVKTPDRGEGAAPCCPDGAEVTPHMLSRISTHTAVKPEGV
jgi:hypothetical protein